MIKSGDWRVVSGELGARARHAVVAFGKSCGVSTAISVRVGSDAPKYGASSPAPALFSSITLLFIPLYLFFELATRHSILATLL